MLRMDRLDRVLEVDREAGLVKVEAGIGLRALSEAIWGYGMALESLGDIDRQTISGAISTATHGTGGRFRNLSTLVEAVELVLPDGTLLDVSADSESELLPRPRCCARACAPTSRRSLGTQRSSSGRRWCWRTG